MMSLNKYKLADIAKIEISGVDKKTIEGEIPVRLCNFVDVYYNWAITKEKAKSFMVASAKQTEIDKCSIGKGMVAITKDSETRDDIGVATYIADDFDNVVLGYHCALIIPNSAVVDGKYLNAFMHTRYIQKYFENNASGSGQRYTLSNDTIGNIPVLLPSIDEQHTIGKVLADIDRKIELNKRINDNLEAMAKQLYDYWFVQFDFPNEEGKPYKSSGGAMVWNEKLKREIPQGWDSSMLQSICTIKRGASPRPIDDFMDESHKGMPWVKISDATNSNSPFMTTIKEHIILDGVPQSVKVIPNTLIVSNSATPGIPKFIQIEACVHDGWLVLTDYQEIYKYYLYYVIKMIRHNLLHIASGSIFKNLKTDYLKEFICITPSTEILSKYHNLVKPIMQEILLLQQDTEALTKQRDELLPLLMNGQASVNYHLSVHFFLPLYYIETNTILWHERNNYTSRFRRYASGSD